MLLLWCKTLLAIMLFSISVRQNKLICMSQVADGLTVDLNEPAFTDPLCHGFRGHIPALSKQKFSSNVIEKVNIPREPEADHS